MNFLVIDLEIADFDFDTELVLERIDASEELLTETRYYAGFRVDAVVYVV